MHHFVQRVLTEHELEDGLMLAIGATGDIAVRMFGPRFGLAVAGFFSGFASSTATISSLGGQAARNSAL